MTAITRCSGCAARLRADAAWCGQCHADVRRSPSGRRARAVPVEQPATTTLGPEESRALAAQWAQRLADAERGAGLPGLVARTRSAGGRAALALGVGAALVAALLLAMLAAGALL